MDSLSRQTEYLQAVANTYRYMLYLNSNSYADPYGNIETLLAASNQAPAEVRHETPHDWELFCKTAQQFKAPFQPLFLSYDLKNCFEDLGSRHKANSGFPLAGMFNPELLEVSPRNAHPVSYYKGTKPQPVAVPEGQNTIQLKPETSREAYREAFEKIRFHLLRGDIYETNYCIRFGAEAKNLQPVELYQKLNHQSPAPFSSLLKWGDSWLICSSPERFLKKNGQELISQPIKGTARRTGNESVDAQTLLQLANDPKERAENIMITDLVRNDLSHFALPGSVTVPEMCGIYPYNRVFQMISTVKASVEPQTSVFDILKKAFPMGSMTGVPKISAMKLADEVETFRRELYSGSVGYLTPEGNFDLNVVIRSFSWNAATGWLSLSTGGAITIRSEADREYDECLLKAEALIQCLLQ